MSRKRVPVVYMVYDDKGGSLVKLYKGSLKCGGVLPCSALLAGANATLGCL
jgi:hypothetical protein